MKNAKIGKRTRYDKKKEQRGCTWDKMKTIQNVHVKNEIGKTIQILRMDAAKSREEISLGLCSITVLLRLEAGERFADKKLIDALIQRLGKSPDKFEFVLGKREYAINQKRIAIDHAFETERYDECRELLEKFAMECKKEDSLNWQYIEKMKFLLRDLKYDTIEEAEELILKMLCRTSPKFKWEEMEDKLLCTEECKLIYLLALTEIEYKCFEKATMILAKLITYLENHFSDVEERIKLYPQIAYSLSMCYEYKKQYAKEMETAKKAIDLLEENGRIYLLAELLECYKNGFLEGRDETNCVLTEEEKEKKRELENQIKVLEEIQKEYGNENGIGVNMISHNYGGQEVHLIHEVLGKKRKIKGLTQEKLSTGICEPETLSRLLSGKQMPNQNTFRMLAECLEIDTERCRPYLTAEDYEVYEKQRKITHYIQRKKFDMAEVLFQEIEQQLSQSEAKNRQFCLATRAIIENRLGRMNWNERLECLEEAIACTIYNYPNVSIAESSLCRQEVILLNNIANTYGRLGNIDKALIIFDNILKSYKSSEVDESYYVEIITLTIYNYTEWLGNLGRYAETLPLYEDAIKMNIRVGRGKLLGGFLYGKAWNMKKVNPNDNIEVCQKYCRQAYYITNLMREDADKDFIMKFGRKNFGEFQL